MPEKTKRGSRGTRSRVGNGKGRSAGASSKNRQENIDLADLEKAGEHLLMSAAELFVGAGFAIKGMKGLIQDEEGRKFLRELPFNVISKSFEMVKEAEEEYRARKKSTSTGRKSKRSRKINVE